MEIRERGPETMKIEAESIGNPSKDPGSRIKNLSGAEMNVKQIIRKLNINKKRKMLFKVLSK